MHLVLGITGKVGGAVARHLVKQGKQVRALVRNREKAASSKTFSLAYMPPTCHQSRPEAWPPKGSSRSCRV